MQLLISDANILIDLEEGGLLAVFFGLPFKFCVPDILFYEELEQQHSHLLELGLGVLELDPASMTYAHEVSQRYKGPSRNDCFALALARQENCPLVTGDRALRRAAEREAVVVMGTLWAVEALVRHEKITTVEARAAYQKMQAGGSRLPWETAFERLAQIEGEQPLQ